MSARPISNPALQWMAVSLSVLLVALMNTVPLTSNDLWLQVRIGQMIADTGHIPRTVLFPFVVVRDNVFNAHEWLPSLVFYELSRIAGVSALMFLQGAAALLQLGLCALLARRVGAPAAVAVPLATLAMIVANYRFVVRPEMFALVFLVLLLLVLNRYRDGGGRAGLLWSIPIGIAWANCHGSFLLGPAIAAVFAIGAAITVWFAAAPGAPAGRFVLAAKAAAPYAFVTLAMLAASIANPMGVKLLSFAFQLQSSKVVGTMIIEWVPTFSTVSLESPSFPVFVVAVALSLGTIAALRHHLDATDALLFLCFLALASERNRHIVWFGFISMAVCARLIGRVPGIALRERRFRFGMLGIGLMGVCATLAFGNVRGDYLYATPSTNFSPAMVAELGDPKLTGNVFNSYELGAELIYRAWPRLMPSIDSRIDSYGDDYFLYTVTLRHDEAALLAFLNAYGVNHMLLLRRDFDNSIKTMPQIRAQWHIRLTDGIVYLLERNVPVAPVVPAALLSDAR